MAHLSHARIEERKKAGPHLYRSQHVGFNGRLALFITNGVGTMWCAYLFAAISLISLPAAIHGGIGAVIDWTAQTFLQLVLLSVIMVGQRVAAETADKRALQMYKDVEALLEMQDQIHRIVEENSQAIKDMHISAKVNS